MATGEPLPKTYDPHAIEPAVYQQWLDGGYFRAQPDDRPRSRTYCIVIPPPNVTAALHMGHALDNCLQDVLVRYHRQRQDNTLWVPGTDHAGIATQAVIEKMIYEQEGKTRHDLGRDEMQRRIWAWKEEYGNRILEQLQRMGCSCDWSRTRFTMDEVCSKAVRTCFFKMFRDHLIYRGKRLVNWDVALQTAVSDDEIDHQTVQGHFWHIRYPLKDPRPGDPPHLVVATTRPETMLGDTAVAVHPDDERYKHLVGRMVILPLLNREMPIIADVWAKPEVGSGCVKITPAHDPNDYDVGLRHKLEMINILHPDGRINDNGGPYAGQDRYEARKRVVEDLQAQGLIEHIEEREIEIGHSHRSGTAIEPYLSDQWFIRMDELAERAMKAVRNRRVVFHPERYAKTYLDWLSEKRDWCISRQLWWGHRIPIWYVKGCNEDALHAAFGEFGIKAVWHWDDEHQRWLCCGLEDLDGSELPPGTECRQDEDVLDTWFSSALWPFSTFGWPEDTEGLLDYYFPTNCLVTAREIISLWVARMVITSLYNLNQVPFYDVFIHAVLLDGRGERMSKSKGNGVDPLAIIDIYGTDAMRYVLCDMCTGMQDVRMPVSIECPHCAHIFPNPDTRQTGIDCPQCKAKMTRPLGYAKPVPDAPMAKLLSTRFEVGRNFCNKLWNSARFAFMNHAPCEPIDTREFAIEDRWILAALNRTVAQSTADLEEYNISAALNGVREFFWGSLCDWYLELIKPRLRTGGETAAHARQVLAYALDQVLRLLHPFVPFITERLWQQLNEQAPHRGLPGLVDLEIPEAVIIAPWPRRRWALDDAQVLQSFAELQYATRGIRDVRARFGVPPRQPVGVIIRASGEAAEHLTTNAHVLQHLAGVVRLEVRDDLQRPANAGAIVSGPFTIYVLDVADDAAERKRITQQLEQVAQQIAAKQAKLMIAGFTQRAPAEVVETERQRLADLQAKQQALQTDLEAIGG
jgi:valyl-tRNA synthetase